MGKAPTPPRPTRGFTNSGNAVPGGWRRYGTQFDHRTLFDAAGAPLPGYGAARALPDRVARRLLRRLQLAVQALDLLLELHHPLDPGEVQALVRELQDAAEAGDVTLAVATAATAGA